MNPRIRNTLVVILLIAIVGLITLFYPRRETTPVQSTATSTPEATESISDGTTTLSYASQAFGLAVTPEQIIPRSYIPPCDTDFNYCFYYIGTEYQGTNFESAGLRVKRRADLTTQSQCLQTLPEGYTGISPSVSGGTDFSTSVFTPLGDAGAGHYAKGTLYRLLYKGSCYEFETRIGASQYANYPRGTIKEFMPADERALEAKLLQLLKDVTLPGGAKPFAQTS